MFDLKSELENYKPFDMQEADNVKRVIEFLKGENCYDRSNLSGHITAGGLVADDKGNVLLNHHKKTGMWFQFGGHSDGDSDCINVARREISEEAGIFDCELISNKIFDVDVQKIDFSAKKNEPEHFHYDINFLFYVKDKKFEVSNESTEIKWVSIDEARCLINPDDQAMCRMLDKYEKLCNIQLHIPSVEELGFRQACMQDPNTMSYNTGYDVHFDGYHYDTGCIDFPQSKWQDWANEKLNNPNLFYAYIVDKSINEFVGYVNFNKNPKTNKATMGIVIKSEFRGRGYMRPAIRKLIEKAKECGVEYLTDTVPENRERALKVFYDLGFEKTGEFNSKKFDKQEVVAEITKKI